MGGNDPQRLLGGSAREAEDFATLPNFVGVGKVLGSLKSLTEWYLRHSKSVFATLPHSLK